MKIMRKKVEEGGFIAVARFNGVGNIECNECVLHSIIVLVTPGSGFKELYVTFRSHGDLAIKVNVQQLLVKRTWDHDTRQGFPRRRAYMGVTRNPGGLSKIVYIVRLDWRNVMSTVTVLARWCLMT